MPKPPSPIRVGMRADDVLKMRGRNVGYAVAGPEWIEYGQSAKWFYADCTVVLQRGKDGYRVTEVLEEVGGDGTGADDENED